MFNYILELYKFKKNLKKIEEKELLVLEFRKKSLQKYKTPKQRLNHLCEISSVHDYSLFEKIKTHNTQSLFEETLKDDEIYSSLLRHPKKDDFDLSNYFIIGNLPKSSQSDFNANLKLIGFCDNINYKHLNSQRDKTKELFNCLIDYKVNKGLVENKSWYPIAIKFNELGNSYILSLTWSEVEYEAYTNKRKALEMFLELWVTVFSDEVQRRVAEIITSDDMYFSIENILELSIMGYNEKLGKEFEHSIFDNPIEWTLSILEPVNETVDF